MAGVQHDDVAFAALSDVKEREHELEKRGSSEDQVSSHNDLHGLDDVHEGLTFPTEEERQTLRRIADTIPWNAYREFPALLISLIDSPCTSS